MSKELWLNFDQCGCSYLSREVRMALQIDTYNPNAFDSLYTTERLFEEHSNMLRLVLV